MPCVCATSFRKRRMSLPPMADVRHKTDDHSQQTILLYCAASDHACFRFMCTNLGHYEKTLWRCMLPWLMLHRCFKHCLLRFDLARSQCALNEIKERLSASLK
eukprot:1228459-Pleurochrysis_carterae.AAC.1